MGLTVPADLDADATAVWAEVAGWLDARMEGGPVDAELLRAWCRSVVELREAEAWVAEHGTVMTVRDDKGNVRSSTTAPKYAQVRALRADLVRLAEAMGVAGKVRRAAPVAGASGPSKLEVLLGGRSVG